MVLSLSLSVPVFEVIAVIIVSSGASLARPRVLSAYLSLRQGEQGAEEHVLLVADQTVPVDVHHRHKTDKTGIDSVGIRVSFRVRRSHPTDVCLNCRRPPSREFR